MKKITPVFFMLSCCAAFAQWNPNTQINTPVSLAGSWQIDLRMETDGQKGAFIVWKDYRNGAPDVYVQHIDSTGTAKWTTDGAPACTDPADQSTPSVVSDMNGGVIVAWSDWRSGIERDLYAQRLDANGNILWTTNGVVVSNKVQREHNERMISDGMGGAIIIFEQQNNSTYNWEIWAQRINSSGNVVWTPGGFPISTVSTNFLNERIQSDGHGGVVITWQDFRNGFDYDVYAQRITANGTKKWGPDGVQLCSVTGTQTNPKVDPDVTTGGYYIAWTDKRNGIDYDIYAQKVDSLGNLLWGSGGAAVCTASGNQSAIDVHSNALTGGVIFAWKDSRSGVEDIYAQKLNPSTGAAMWTTNGVVICNSTGSQLNPNISGDSNGGAVIVWQDQSAGTGNDDVKAQRVNTNGVVQWAANGVNVGNATGAQTSPKNISDGAGGSIFAWEDSRSGQPDIYCHHIYAAGGNVGLDEVNYLMEAGCYPNPFNTDLNISFTVVQTENVSVKIFDASGRMVADVLSADILQKPGTNTLSIDTKKHGMEAGVYFVKLKGNTFAKTLKVLKSE